MPPRGLGGGRLSIAARFQAKKEESENPGDTPAGVTEVGWAWHEEEDRRPVLLPTSLRDRFPDGTLIRVKFSEKPELPFYIRAHTESYQESKSGNISIQKSILTAAGVRGLLDKKAQLEKAKDSAADLQNVVMVISDVYMSKRDLWHLHLAMMQQRGRVLYCGYNNFSEHVPSSNIEQLVGADGRAVSSGTVGVKTTVTFRSSSTHMFLLIEVSAELFRYGLMGLPYWQMLLDCLGQCIERVCTVSGKRISHYLRIVLFARRRPTVATPERRPPNRKDFTAFGPPGNHQDFYDVIFEGYTSALPSQQELRSRVSNIFLTLLEEEEKYKKDPESWVKQRSEQGLQGLNGQNSASPWQSMRAGELAESHEGCILECLNLALDHFDAHHLDRLLKVSGQVVVIMTAGSGLINTPCKELYLLTNRRCISAGHSSFRIIGVRDPPWHRVPWIQWPGSPSISELVIPTRQPDPEWEGDTRLTPFPAWLSYISYQEAVFCPCLENRDWLKAVFLPLLDGSMPDTKAPVPAWGPQLCSLENQPTERQEIPDVSPTSMPHFQESDSLRAFRVFSNQKTWDEIRLPQLRSHIGEPITTRPDPPPGAYSVNPARFGEEGAKLDLMYDFVGLRLAALGGTHINRWEGSCEELVNVDEKNQVKEPWQAHGSRLPKSLRNLTVSAACGSQWRFEPTSSGIKVARHERFDRDKFRDKATSFLYEQYFVHLSSWNGPHWIESRSVFHMQERLDWNFLDHVLAGVYDIPPALPYPVDRAQLNEERLPRRDTSTRSLAGDRRDGWQLRGALKQHMLILMPQSHLASSHSEMMRCILSKLGGQISIGKDPFDAFEEIGGFEKNQELLLEALKERQLCASGSISRQVSRQLSGGSREASEKPQEKDRTEITLYWEAKPEEQPDYQPEVSRATTMPQSGYLVQDEVDPDADSRQLMEDFVKLNSDMIQRFKEFLQGMKKLCFGRLPRNRFDAKSMGVDTSMQKFTVGRKQLDVTVRHAELESSFSQSRDWFGIFYDDVYCPPKFFHMVVEWIACSSVHMSSFLTKLDKLAAQHGFRLLRLPIGVLFPQPAPSWIWTSDQETNFDRLPFYPRQRINLPPVSGSQKELYAKLLEAWLRPPLNFHFIFSSPIQDFQVHLNVAEDVGRCPTKEVYQRLKGWTLCDSEGLCLATLREECVFFFENHLALYGSRNEERVQSCLRRAAKVRSLFFEISTAVLESQQAPKLKGLT